MGYCFTLAGVVVVVAELLSGLGVLPVQVDLFLPTPLESLLVIQPDVRWIPVGLGMAWTVTGILLQLDK